MMFLKTWQYSQEDTCVAISFFFDKETQHRCFSVSIAKFSKAPILKNICEQMLLSFADP